MFFVRILREYERGVVFLSPIVDRIVKVDLRTITLNIPPQEVITKDNVPARVNAVAYLRIVDPKAAIVQIENFIVATSQIAQTTLRSVLGQHTLDELLSERERRAKLINAECEFQASARLKDAALVIEEHPIALQLRYLQTLLETGGSNSSTIIFPAPIDVIKPFLERATEPRTITPAVGPGRRQAA
jgi:regulator of protease activity HflC (stomatin/prohibitin superfamily)